MGYIVKSIGGNDTTGTAQVVPASDENSTYANNDLILVGVHNREQNQSWSETSSEGWSIVKEVVSTRGTYTIFGKFTTGTENDPTFTVTGSGVSITWSLTIIRGLDTTSINDVVIDSATSEVNDDQITLPTLNTTGESNALCIYFISTEVYQKKWHFENKIKTELNLDWDNSGTTSGQSIAAYVQQSATAATPAFIAVASTTAVEAVAYAIALKDNGNGDIKGQVDPTVAPSELIHYLFATSTGAYSGDYSDSTTANRKVDLSALISKLDDPSTGTATAHLGGKLITSTPFGDSYNGIQPAFLALQPTTGSQYDLPNLTGFKLNSSHPLWNSTGIDISNSIIHCLCYSTNSSIETWGNDGSAWVCPVSGDNTNGGAASFRIAAKDTIAAPHKLNAPYLMDTSNSANYNTHTVGTGSLDLANIDHFAFGSRATDSNATAFGFLMKMATMVMIGGSTTFPCSFADAEEHARKTSMYTVQNNGGQSKAFYLCAHNIQIGNGSDALNWNSSGQGIEMPSAHSVADLFVHSNIEPGALTISVKLASTNIVNIQNQPFIGGDLHNFVIDAANSTSATWTGNGAGASFVSWNVTLRDVGFPIAWTFSECSELVYNDADMSGGCTIDACVDTQAITITGATQAAIQATLDKFANATFSNNTKALRIEYTGTGDITLNFDNITFTSNTIDIHYNATNSSALTANMQNGSNAAQGKTEVSGSATSVTVSNDVTFTININVSGANLTLLEENSTTEVVEYETAGTQEVYTYTYVSDQVIDINCHLPGYKTFWSGGEYTLGNSSQVLNITLEADPASQH